MCSSFNDIVLFLEKDIQKDNELKPEQFKEACEALRAILHDKVNLAQERLVEYGTKAFEKEDKKFQEENQFKKIDDDSTKDVKSKVHDLVASLDGMLKRTEFIDDSITTLKNEPLDKILVSRKGEIDFKMTRKFQLKVEGKCLFDISWLNPQNKPNFSDIDTKDNTVLNVHATSCYNYYQLDKEFTDENVEVTFVTDCYQSSNYFYFGVRNETNQPNNHCMCCNPASCLFFRVNGKVSINGTTRSEPKLNMHFKKDDHRVKIRLMASEKQVYFTVNDNEECGPYALSGNRFTVTSGSCNTLNGTIRIESAQFI